MDTEQLLQRLRLYQMTAIFSVVFALVGFSYNVWRMEASEHNDTTRNAAFELLLQLAELEQLVYAAHYDDDPVGGNPRVGWVKVGLIADLSTSCDPPVGEAAEQLRTVWGEHWAQLPSERPSADAIVSAIDATRGAVQDGLRRLE